MSALAAARRASCEARSSEGSRRQAPRGSLSAYGANRGVPFARSLRALSRAIVAVPRRRSPRSARLPDMPARSDEETAAMCRLSWTALGAKTVRPTGASSACSESSSGHPPRPAVVAGAGTAISRQRAPRRSGDAADGDDDVPRTDRRGERVEECGGRPPFSDQTADSRACGRWTARDPAEHKPRYE